MSFCFMYKFWTIVFLLVCLYIFIKILSKSEGQTNSAKQFDVSVEQIIVHQMVQAPPEFSLEEKKLVEGLREGNDELIKNSVTFFTQQIAKAARPLPAYYYPIPKTIPVLSMRVLQYVGVYAEGIFRRGIDMALIPQYLLTIDQGRIATLTAADSHTYAVVLKTWLRRLDPLVPYSVYKKALEFAKDADDDDDDDNSSNSNDPTSTYGGADTFNYYNMNDGTGVTPVTTFLDTNLTPAYNLSLKYLVRFLRIFTVAPYVQTNLMNLDNIARVMAPNVMHADAKGGAVSPIDAIVNLPLEIKFTTLLLRELCIRADEETLFESIDTAVRAELAVPEEACCSVLNYYTWG